MASRGQAGLPYTRRCMALEAAAPSSCADAGEEESSYVSGSSS
jgi:hypothetical protein